MFESFLSNDGVDREIRALIAEHLSPDFNGNPSVLLRRYVNADSVNGRRILARLVELTGQVDDRTREQQEPIIQALLAKLPADFVGNPYAEVKGLASDPATIWRLKELSLEYQAARKRYEQ